MLCKELCRELYYRRPEEYIWLALGIKLERKQVEILTEEFGPDEVQPDFVARVRVGTRAGIVHLEFHTITEMIEMYNYPPNIEFPHHLRMRNCYVEISKKYPEIPIVQMLVILKKTEAGERLENSCVIDDIKIRFSLKKMWEEDTEKYLTPGLLPLAVLTKTDDREALVYRVAQIIQKM